MGEPAQRTARPPKWWGWGYPDLIRLRGGRLGPAPDAVVMPGSPSQVSALLEICSREGIAVVPFGGGTSVVGGVDPVAGPHRALIALDLRRMRGVEVDRISLTATLGAGLRGPEAEDALRAQGLSIGPFPQSFEYATIGGFAAAPSAGGRAGARTARPGRRCASSRSAPRACSGRSPRSRSAYARHRRRAATRPGSRPTSPPGAS